MTNDVEAAEKVIRELKAKRARLIARPFKNAHGMSKAREAAEPEAQALENYDSPRWQENRSSG
jgi:hypothetical protein